MVRRGIYIHRDTMEGDKQQEAHFKKPSFNERYFQIKFKDKKQEIANQLKIYPDDLVAKRQLQFIDRLLLEGQNEELNRKINWSSVWKNWENQNFLPYDLYKDGT